MKRTLLFMLIAIVVLFVSCDRVPYKVGDIGPAGGCIVYDCDKDNRKGNPDGLTSAECGWRYMEVAPETVSIGEQDTFVFGYYRTTDNGTNTCLNGQQDIATLNVMQKIGNGKDDTSEIVAKFGDEAYSEASGSAKTEHYAAKVADEYSVTVGGVTYDDWFLPSIGELYYVKLYCNDSSLFETEVPYASSTESSNLSYYVLRTQATGFLQGLADRSTPAKVLCIRTFLPEE